MNHVRSKCSRRSGSPCCAQSCPLKVSSLLKGLHCIRSSKWLGKARRAQLRFSLSGCWTAHLSGVGSSWSKEEVSDTIRYWILYFRAKAISFPQCINTNNFRLGKGISLKDIIPPFRFTGNF